MRGSEPPASASVARLGRLVLSKRERVITLEARARNLAPEVPFRPPVVLYLVQPLAAGRNNREMAQTRSPRAE
jgi:hypothetical protein